MAVHNGGRPVSQPAVLQGPDGQESVMSEVEMYGDVVMRFMSGSFQVILRPRWSMMHESMVRDNMLAHILYALPEYYGSNVRTQQDPTAHCTLVVSMTFMLHMMFVHLSTSTTWPVYSDDMDHLRSWSPSPVLCTQCRTFCAPKCACA